MQVYVLRQDYASAYLIALYLQATRPSDPEAVRDAGIFLYYLKRYPGKLGPWDEGGVSFGAGPWP